MSTRGAYGIRKDGVDKISYNHYDSYPDGLGRAVMTFCMNHSQEEISEFFDRIILVQNDTPADDKARKWYDALKRMECDRPGRHVCDEEWQKLSTGRDTWYWILHSCMGDLEKLYRSSEGYAISYTYMKDDRDFLLDGIFCEYAYIINLDSGMLEYWIGGRSASRAKNRYWDPEKETREEYDQIVCSLQHEVPLDKICGSIINKVMELCYPIKYETYKDDEMQTPPSW